jgi:thiamine-phosphate pyrophosphorylase
LLRHVAAHSRGDERPWFAIGGIETLARLDEVIAAGARRVVVVRALTGAEDPGAAAAAFAARLRAAS